MAKIAEKVKNKINKAEEKAREEALKEGVKLHKKSYKQGSSLLINKINWTSDMKYCNINSDVWETVVGKDKILKPALVKNMIFKDGHFYQTNKSGEEKIYE